VNSAPTKLNESKSSYEASDSVDSPSIRSKEKRHLQRSSSSICYREELLESLCTRREWPPRMQLRKLILRAREEAQQHAWEISRIRTQCVLRTRGRTIAKYYRKDKRFVTHARASFLLSRLYSSATNYINSLRSVSALDKLPHCHSLTQLRENRIFSIRSAPAASWLSLHLLLSREKFTGSSLWSGSRGWSSMIQANAQSWLARRLRSSSRWQFSPREAWIVI